MFILFQDRYLVFKFFERKFSSLRCHVTCAIAEGRIEVIFVKRYIFTSNVVKNLSKIHYMPV